MRCCLRKEKGITQKELADAICVSDKTVSKWENGNSLPDTSMLLVLCHELEVSVNELLNCERIPPENYSKKAEATIMNLIKENQNGKKYYKIQCIFGIFFLAVMAIMIYMSSMEIFTWFLDAPSFLALTCGCVASALLSGKRRKGEIVRVLRKTVLPIGGVITCISVVTVLYYGKNIELLRVNFSVAIIALIYSCVFYVLFFLLEQHWLKD